MFFYKTQPEAPLAQVGFYLLLLIAFAFAILTWYNPVVGLTGIGVILIATGIWTEVCASYVYNRYIKNIKRSKKMPFWGRPSRFYYNVNIWILWPAVIVFGAVCLWAAYMLTQV
jgi:uncharacterized membrane protein YidH (DUF202 family)